MLSTHRAAQQVCSLPPCGGGVGRGVHSRLRVRSVPPSLSLPRRKAGLPDLRNVVRNPGKPGFRGGGNGAARTFAKRLVRVRVSQIHPPHHLPCGRRRLALRIVLHPPAAARVLAAERQIDAALVLPRPAFDHRPIGFADAAALEQAAELGQRLPMAAEHQAAGGIAVEPVRERGRARQPEAERAEIVLQALAALRPLVDRETRRLVDHQHEAVAIEQASHYLFRGHAAITTVIMSEVKPTSDPDANAALIRRFYDEVFNRGNVAFADRVHGAGYRYHDTTERGPPVDHATYMTRNAGFAAAFPDRKVEIEDLIATGDRVVARAILHATHTGLLGDIAPTGRKVRLASTIIYRFEQGRVVEEWEIFNKLGMYQQLRVTPPPARAIG